MQNISSYLEDTFICNSECIRILSALYFVLYRIIHGVNPEVEQYLPSVCVLVQPYAEHVCIKHTHY